MKVSVNLKKFFKLVVSKNVKFFIFFSILFNLEESGYCYTDFRHERMQN